MKVLFYVQLKKLQREQENQDVIAAIGLQILWSDNGVLHWNKSITLQLAIVWHKKKGPTLLLAKAAEIVELTAVYW